MYLNIRLWMMHGIFSNYLEMQQFKTNFENIDMKFIVTNLKASDCQKSQLETKRWKFTDNQNLSATSSSCNHHIGTCYHINPKPATILFGDNKYPGCQVYKLYTITRSAIYCILKPYFVQLLPPVCRAAYLMKPCFLLMFISGRHVKVCSTLVFSRHLQRFHFHVSSFWWCWIRTEFRWSLSSDQYEMISTKCSSWFAFSISTSLYYHRREAETEQNVLKKSKCTDNDMLNLLIN